MYGFAEYRVQSAVCGYLFTHKRQTKSSHSLVYTLSMSQHVIYDNSALSVCHSPHTDSYTKNPKSECNFSFIFHEIHNSRPVARAYCISELEICIKKNPFIHTRTHNWSQNCILFFERITKCSACFHSIFVCVSNLVSNFWFFTNTHTIIESNAVYRVQCIGVGCPTPKPNNLNLVASKLHQRDKIASIAIRIPFILQCHYIYCIRFYGVEPPQQY